jgi:hypothetical protein
MDNSWISSGKLLFQFEWLLHALRELVVVN